MEMEIEGDLNQLRKEIRAMGRSRLNQNKEADWKSPLMNVIKNKRVITKVYRGKGANQMEIYVWAIPR